MLNFSKNMFKISHLEGSSQFSSSRGFRFGLIFMVTLLLVQCGEATKEETTTPPVAAQTTNYIEETWDGKADYLKGFSIAD